MNKITSREVITTKSKEDLIRALVPELEAVMVGTDVPWKIVKIFRDATVMLERIDSIEGKILTNIIDSKRTILYQINGELVSALNSYAPKGMYFGPFWENDSSDCGQQFGWWYI
jgi:hypothetical protein|tara:strand:+ start:82 stop:423 length:342 start_codon:yes stop_codon:yes gene_type:complete